MSSSLYPSSDRWLGAAGLVALGLGGAACCCYYWWRRYGRERRGYPSSPTAMQERSSSVRGTINGASGERHLKLYHSYPFRSSRCAWLVNELGVSRCVAVIPVSLHGADASKLMSYREVHPHGTLPAMSLEDGTVLLESAGICLYLAEVFLDPDGLSLLPDPEYTADYYDLITYATSTLDHILEPLYMQLTHVPEEQRNQSLIDSMRRKFGLCANVLSTRLGDRDFVCGSKFTAADCVIGYCIWWASAIKDGSLLKDFPVLQSYLERLKERPAFKLTFQRKKKKEEDEG